MAKMCFPITVKYDGSKYPPHTAIEVRDEEVADLKKAGGWLIESPSIEPEVNQTKTTAKRTARTKKQEE